MTQAVTYERETKAVAFQGKIIVLESLTPVLPPKEKAQRKKEIERCLYEVFSKYGDRFPYIIKRVDVYSDYRLHIEFNMSFAQFELGLETEVEYAEQDIVS